MKLTTRLRIEELERRVSAIHDQIQKLQAEPFCPICGSRSTASTAYPRRFCRNEYGYCGMLVMHAWSGPYPGQRDPHSVYYSRTSWRTDTGALTLIRPIPKPAVEIYFVCSVQVTRAQYIGELTVES